MRTEELFEAVRRNVGSDVVRKHMYAVTADVLVLFDADRTDDVQTLLACAPDVVRTLVCAGHDAGDVAEYLSRVEELMYSTPDTPDAHAKRTTSTTSLPHKTESDSEVDAVRRDSTSSFCSSYSYGSESGRDPLPVSVGSSFIFFVVAAAFVLAASVILMLVGGGVDVRGTMSPM